jgi:hypothetical protein
MVPNRGCFDAEWSAPLADLMLTSRSLRARESRFMDIEVPVVELAYLAQELESGGMDTLTVMVRFFEEGEPGGLKDVTDWLRTLPE